MYPAELFPSQIFPAQMFGRFFDQDGKIYLHELTGIETADSFHGNPGKFPVYWDVTYSFARLLPEGCQRYDVNAYAQRLKPILHDENGAYVIPDSVAEQAAFEEFF